MSVPKPLPDAAYLNECFDYNPDTGSLTWRNRPIHHFKNESYCETWNKTYAGRQTGKTIIKMHHTIKVKGSIFLVHRIIWNMYYGEDPGRLEIDHINRNPLDNRICNLRLATREQNERNKLRRANRKETPKGVSYKESEKKFYAYIKLNGKTKNLGGFKSVDDAKMAYENIARQLYGEFHAMEQE